MNLAGVQQEKIISACIRNNGGWMLLPVLLLEVYGGI